MNKILPVLIVVMVGLGIIGGAAWFFLGNKSTTVGEEIVEKEEASKELAIEDKPYISLTPRADGRELNLIIMRIPAASASLDYELGYKTASGVGEGVTGNIKLKGESKIERPLLLGSCSSGKCRYHEGVEDGTVTLKLRDSKGKLIAKLQSSFHMQQGESKLTLPSKDFTYTLNKVGKSSFYLTMDTIGLPSNAPGKVVSGPVGVFSKDVVGNGTVELEGTGDLYSWNGSKWVKLDESNKSTSFGTFVRIASE